MNRADPALTAIAEHVVAETLAPIQCPCEFGENGRYQLEELIGVGRSHVYRATDTLLSSDGFKASVVVKIQSRSGADHEALTARRVEHPNVVRIIDRGVQDNLVYVVMEYLDGPSLDECKVPVPANDAARLVASIASAAHAAHSAGVVHCDLKPGNIILSRDGQPKLLDFDLASSRINPDPRTRGNVAFMSPEQFAGDANALTPPSDVYAIGGILHWLLTGSHPNGSTYAEIASSHASNAPPANTGAEHDLDAICRRALSRDRARRHESAAALADDLQRWLSLRPIEWMRPSTARRLSLWARRERVKAVFATAIFCAICALVWIGVWTVAKQREAVRVADQRVEQTAAKVRTHILTLAKSVQTGADVESRMLPFLTWIGWLVDEPIIHDDGRIPTSPERIDSLRLLVDLGEKERRSRHTDVLIARYALAYYLVLENKPLDAQPVIESLSRDWSPLLDQDEPVARSLAAVRACNDHLLLNTGREKRASAATLKQMRSDLSTRPGCTPATRLIDATLARSK